MVMHYGEQFHHNNPSLLTDQLYLSAARALSSRVLLELGITCVINATLELPTVAYQKQECMQIAVEDNISTKLYMYFDLVADKINAVHHNGGKMIVYCRAGMSRSAALCIAYFMKYHGMNVDDAYQYVRERRPIIHPNSGFMRQLRDYEKKLRAKRSQPCLHKFGDPLLPHQPMPELVYATEESETSLDNLPDLSDIKPRPKPRIPKFQQTEIKFCCPEVYIVETGWHESPSQSVEPLPLAKKVRTKSKKFLALPTPALTFSFAHLKVLATPVLEGLNVAEVMYELPFGNISPTFSFLKEPLSRVPFVKLSEPIRVAVSFFTLPFCECYPYSTGRHQPERAILGVVFGADSHSILAQVSQEIPSECQVNLLTTTLKERANVVVVRLPTVASVCQQPAIYECHGLLQHQKLDHFTAQCTPPVRVNPQGPSRIQRGTTTRMSLRLPGINIKPAMEKHQKIPHLISSDYFSVPSCSLPPIYFETTQANVGRFRSKEHLCCATVILYLPTLSTAIQVENCVVDVETKFVRTLNLITQMAVPFRKYLMTSHSVATCRKVVSLTTEKDSPKFVLPPREYPYYVRTPRLEPIATERVKNVACVESTWFFPLNPKSQQAKKVQLEKSGVPMRNVILELPALQWAAERSEFDIESQWREARLLHTAICLKEKFTRSSHFAERNIPSIHEVIPNIEVAFFSKPKLPEAYNSWSVMRMCVHPMYGAATSSKQVALVMNNIYCEPRPFFAFAKMVLCTQSVPAQGLNVVETSQDKVSMDFVELTEIPDVVGDISTIKSKLVNQNDSAKLAIWLEVFKRSVLKARPVLPFVILSETLPIAEIQHESVVYDSFEEFQILPRRLSVHDKPTIAVARPVLSYPVLVTQCENEDAEMCFQEVSFFNYKPACPPTQKASETRDYICHYTELSWNQVVESTLCNDERCNENFTSVTAQVIVTKPNDFFISTTQLPYFGEVCPTQFSSCELERIPFSRLTCLHMSPLHKVDFALVMEKQMPNFVPIQEQADVQYLAKNLDLSILDSIQSPPDILWFFQMATPILKRRDHQESTGQDPFAHYSLFLPDSDAIERLGAEPVEEFFDGNTEDGAKHKGADKVVILDPKQVISEAGAVNTTDLVQGSVKPRGSRVSRDRRVMINDVPTSVNLIPPEPPQPVSRLGSNLVSYQRPSNLPTQRSRSRSFRRSNRSDSERRTMVDLEASVRHASDLLERRRLAKESTAASSYLQQPSGNYDVPIQERGRETQRTSRISTQSSSDQSPISLRGLLDFAQNWITSHKSRREVSMERSSFLLRRSRHY